MTNATLSASKPPKSEPDLKPGSDVPKSRSFEDLPNRTVAAKADPPSPPDPHAMLRIQANYAINAGADPDAVKERFAEITGKHLYA